MMIQIQEKDALWRFYQRHYKDRLVPEPRNLCNYFWKAVSGALKTIMWDTNILITMLVMGVVTGAIWLTRYLTGSWSDAATVSHVLGFLFFGAALMVTGGFTLVVPVIRWFEYWSKRNENIQIASGIAFGAMIIDVMLSTAFVQKGNSWHWWYLLYGLGIEVGLVAGVAICVGVWYLCFSDNTNLGKNILPVFGGESPYSETAGRQSDRAERGRLPTSPLG